MTNCCFGLLIPEQVSRNDLPRAHNVLFTKLEKWEITHVLGSDEVAGTQRLGVGIMEPRKIAGKRRVHDCDGQTPINLKRRVSCSRAAPTWRPRTIDGIVGQLLIAAVKLGV